MSIDILRMKFKVFIEEEEKKDPSLFVKTIKKQLKIPKKLWFGMPLLVSNKKLGKYFIQEPTMFYVKDFDSHTVTLKNIEDHTTLSGSDGDSDGEIDLDDNGEIEVTISRDDFYKLQEPDGMPAGGGSDLGGGLGGGLGMGGGLGGGLGGI